VRRSLLKRSGVRYLGWITWLLFVQISVVPRLMVDFKVRTTPPLLGPNVRTFHVLVYRSRKASNGVHHRQHNLAVSRPNVGIH
jgi:hypothetical protein